MADTAPLNAEHLAAYFALMEVGSLLHHAVEQQLRTDGGLSYVQFQILARLSDSPDDQQRMTDLADQVVYSRSGLTYQAGQLEKAGLVTRGPSVDDERATTVTITAAGRALLERVLPGHIAIVRQLLLPPLSHHDITALTRMLGRVRTHMAICAQRPETVKVRMSGSAGPFRPLQRGPRHDGSGVREVYFLHSASMWPHLVRVSPRMRADPVAKIIMRIACRGAGFLHSTVSTQDEGQEAHPLGTFYLFGALGKNSHSEERAAPYTRNIGRPAQEVQLQ